MVSESHVQELATLIGLDWTKLANQLGLTEEQVKLYKKKQVVS